MAKCVPLFLKTLRPTLLTGRRKRQKIDNEYFLIITSKRFGVKSINRDYQIDSKGLTFRFSSCIIFFALEVC